MADLSIIIKALLQGTNIDQQTETCKRLKEKLLIGTRLIVMISISLRFVAKLNKGLN